MGRELLAAQLSRFDEIGEQAKEKSAWKRREGARYSFGFDLAINSSVASGAIRLLGRQTQGPGAHLSGPPVSPVKLKPQDGVHRLGAVAYAIKQ